MTIIYYQRKYMTHCHMTAMTHTFSVLFNEARSFFSLYIFFQTIHSEIKQSSTDKLEV